MKSERTSPVVSRDSSSSVSARRPFKQWRPSTLALATLLGFAAVSITAQAQTLTVLHSFSGGVDGSFPSGLIRDQASNLYGTTYYGGNYRRCNPPKASGCGTLFKIDANGNKTVLHNFTGGMEGGNPYSGVIRDAAGNLYGTTLVGGDLTCNHGLGCGIVFKLQAAGNFTVLYRFHPAPDATGPGALIADAKGNLYGVSQSGGSANIGAVFKLDASGKETVLHSFTGGADGAFPFVGVGVIRDPAGSLYGTTYVGGDTTCGCGVAFKIDAAGKESVLHSFSGTPDGGLPHAGLIGDATGNLYGTTQVGGAFDFGTVFTLDKTGKETVLYSFTGGSDGGYPFGGLIRDAEGNLYGTTNYSTTNLDTVFKLDSANNFTVVHTLSQADGGGPYAGVIMDTDGNLYGTGTGGGAFGYGTVFKIAP